MKNYFQMECANNALNSLSLKMMVDNAVLTIVMKDKYNTLMEVVQSVKCLLDPIQ